LKKNYTNLLNFIGLLYWTVPWAPEWRKQRAVEN